jgi:hypothetical protein
MACGVLLYWQKRFLNWFICSMVIGLLVHASCVKSLADRHPELVSGSFWQTFNNYLKVNSILAKKFHTNTIIIAKNFAT